MGKLYYCEVCNRSFRDTIHDRKKHRKSNQHQQLTQIHYQRFSGKDEF